MYHTSYIFYMHGIDYGPIKNQNKLEKCYLAQTVNTKRWPTVGLMLGQRRRRWADISPTVGQLKMESTIIIITEHDNQ